ncbi:MAG: c-type cytochrome [Gemmatimonadetes bacterium]|nr:c-type cytochrome [Gemmatimonadota bacterium]
MAQRTLSRETRFVLSLLVLSLVPLACNKGRYGDQVGGGTMSSPPAGIPSESANPPMGDTGARAKDTPKGAGATSADVAMGDKIFHGKMAGGTCFSCHGQDAKGTTLAPDLTDGQWLNTDGSREGIESVITNGVAKPKKHQAGMPPMGGAKLSPDQVQAVAAYVYSLSH